MMRIATSLAITLSAALFLTGCGEDTPSTSSTPPTSHAHPHPHPHDGDHNGHAHDHPHTNGHHHHSGPKHELGSQQIGPYAVAVKQVGDVEAGHPATFEIVLTEHMPRPSAVRAWVGNEQAIGAVKVLAVRTPAYYDADLEVAATMPEDSQLWVEIETEDGQRHTGSFEVR